MSKKLYNAGHSAEIFLENNKNIHLTSFDIGEHHYTKIGKKFIYSKYKNRHTFILGNSIETVPKYIKKRNKKLFDLIYIDGGHDYEIAKQDLHNCSFLAHKDTIVILDDTNTNPHFMKYWQKGPTKAWYNAKKKYKIYEIGSLNFPPNHGISYGKYLFRS